MSAEAHHRDALIQTARDELDRAHRAAVALSAGDMRRGLQLALTALQGAAAEAVEPALPELPGLSDAVAKALADLDSGNLSEMESLIERVRTSLVATPG